MGIGADIVTNDYFGPITIQNHEMTAQYLVDVSYSNSGSNNEGGPQTTYQFRYSVNKLHFACTPGRSRNIINKNALQWDAYRPLVDNIPACTVGRGRVSTGQVGCLPLGEGVSAQGCVCPGMCLPGGCLPRGCIQACNGADIPRGQTDTPQGQTDTYENITFVNFI